MFLNLASSFEVTASAGLVTLLFVREDTGGGQFRFASSEATNLQDGTATAAAGTYAPRLVFDAARPGPLSLTIASGRHFQTVVAVGLVGVLAACRGGRRAGRLRGDQVGGSDGATLDHHLPAARSA